MPHVLTDEVPDKVRLFFKTTDGVLRQFLFFKGEGEDIYWGPPGVGPAIVSTAELSGSALSITVGDETEDVGCQGPRFLVHLGCECW